MCSYTWRPGRPEAAKEGRQFGPHPRNEAKGPTIEVRRLWPLGARQRPLCSRRWFAAPQTVSNPTRAVRRQRNTQ
eukprot:9851591-Alexandrium_andersonii.AAC.1